MAGRIGMRDTLSRSGDPRNWKTVEDELIRIWKAIKLLNTTGGEAGGGSTITPGSVTLADIQNIGSGVVLGRSTAGLGVIEQLTLSQALDLIGSAAQGDLLYRGAASWARLPAGTNGYLLQTQGAGANPQWASFGAGGFLSGTGHPQGAVSANVGSFYVDTNTGNVFRKLGGAATAYGWYYEKPGNSVFGPQRYAIEFLGDSDVAAMTAQSSWGRGIAWGSTNNAWIATSALGTNTRLLLTDGYWNQSQTVSTNGTVGLLRTGQGIVAWLDQDFDITFHIYLLTAVTTVRYFVGIFSAAPTNSDNNTGNGIGFRFSTNVPDAGWVGYTRNSTGPVVNTTASLGTVAISTRYKLRMRFIRSGTPTVYFSVDDGTETAVTTGIPATGGTQAWYLNVTPLANVARPIAWRAVDMIFGAQV